VEMRYAVEDPIEILIPHAYGAELAAAKQSKSKAKDWTADRVLKVLADSGTDESVIRNITRLVEWCQSNGANFNPGVTPRVEIFIRDRRQRNALASLPTSVKVESPFAPANAPVPPSTAISYTPGPRGSKG
jgi:hypothetical protein